MKDDDFISVQNLVDTNITFTTRDKSFDSVEVSKVKQQGLLIRLYKRLFVKTIKRKFGYVKANSKVEPCLSQFVFCENLGLNPNLLKLVRAVIYTDSENDTGITWLQYL